MAALLMLAAAAALFAAGLFFYRNRSEEQLQTREEAEQAALYEEISPEPEAEETSGEDYLAKVRAVNPQAAAWLTIPDTTIDFPVVQGDDNAYYLSHDLNRESSRLGVPFLDYRCESDFSGFQSIIYGHHITKERMFTPLVHFTETEYFDSHEFGWLVTEREIYKIHFIACLVVEHDAFVYQTVFLTDAEKEAFLAELKKQAVRQREFSAEEMAQERLLTLSTCSYEFENARTVLVGWLEPASDNGRLLIEY